jgi:catechol 2,3-dioxygenase-like lactoylglutathione lyase family enzyme
VIEARFGHVNVIARDWRRLAGFYGRVFGMEVVPPERDYSGPDFEAGTGIPGARLRGVHLRLPGLGEGRPGPTLEIYEYETEPETPPPSANRPGWGHLAFVVPDVAEAKALFIAEGGAALGKVITSTVADGRHVTWVYVRDPEGNIVELQSWSAPVR